MSAVTLPVSSDGRERHGAYRVHRTLAFPPGMRHLSALVRHFMAAMETTLQDRELAHAFKAVVLRAAKGAVCDVLWCERQLRANEKLRVNGDLNPESATVQWLMWWRRRRELDLLDVFKSAGLDRPAPLDIHGIIASVHAQQAAPVATGRNGNGKDDPGIVQSGNDAPTGTVDVQGETAGATDEL